MPKFLGTVNINTGPGGDEGGEIVLAPASTNTTVSGNVVLDVYQNRLRIFESGGSNRGAYIDLTAASAGVGSNLLAGGGGGATTLDGLTDVTAPSPTNGDFLKWNGSAWVNDPIDLATDTTGNYVSSLVAGTGITLANNSGEGATPTISIDSATVATLTGTQTLSNKTLSNPTILGSISLPQYIIFEGATADAYETVLSVVEPTGDRLITLPNRTGTVITDGDTGTVTSTMIADGTIVNGDISATAGVSLSKLASGSAGQVVVANSSGVPTYTTITGAISIDDTGFSSLSADSVALGFDTTGDYVASLVAGTGITITNNGGEGSTPTISSDASLPAGTVQMFAGSTTPTGWLSCDGSAVSRATYSALFDAIGTTYGAGNGSTTFNLPDMRSRMPVGAGQGAGLTNRSVATTGGAESVTIGSANLPNHTHTLSAHTHTSAAHSHTSAAHSHGLGGHTHNGPSHAHNIPRSLIATAGTNRAVVSANPNQPTLNVDAGGTGATGVPSGGSDSTTPGDTGSTTPGATGAPSTDTTGNGGFANSAMGIMNPFIALNFIIKV